jgi:hypothetical protein
MPFWPQQPNSILIESANFYTSTSAASVDAVCGDVILHTPTGAAVVNLPASPPAGALVTVRVLAAFAVTVKSTDSSTINNVAGATGVAITGNVVLGVGATFEFDGTAWWVVNS